MAAQEPPAIQSMDPAILEARLSSIVESSDDAILSKDIDGTITSWNRGAELLYGYTAAEMIGRNVSVLVPAHRAREEIKILETITAGGRVDHYETERRRKDGSIVDVSVTVSPVRGPDGTVVGASAIARDLTERKRFERVFISNAAHELRSPLATLTGLADLLIQHRHSMTDEEVEASITAMGRQAERAAVLVLNLLDLSRLEAGAIELDIEHVSLRDAVASVLLSSPPPDGVTVDVDVPDDLMADADGFRLSQVLTNLLGNAFRYGGPTVRIKAVAREDNVRVVVMDDGPGVPDTIVPYLFDPFVRGGTGRHVIGSGLGLAIVRQLMTAMSGTIWYEPGDPGARFVFTLPMR